MNAYSTEGGTYKEIMSNQGLTVEGLLSYLTTRAIEGASSDVNVNLEAPAKTSYPWMIFDYQLLIIIHMLGLRMDTTLTSYLWFLVSAGGRKLKKRICVLVC